MKKLLAIVVLGLLLSGCAGGLGTKYEPEGFRGGYSDQQIARNIFKVTFKGNGYTGRQTVQNRAMLRAAELTLEKDYDLFAIILDDQIIIGPSGYGTQNKHRTTLEIKMFKFSDYIKDINLTKEEYKNKIEERNNKLGDTNLFIAEDTLKYLDNYR